MSNRSHSVEVDSLGKITYRAWVLFERPGRNSPRWTGQAHRDGLQRCVSASNLDTLLNRIDHFEATGENLQSQPERLWPRGSVWQAAGSLA